jgi:hypothetical protein
MTNGTISISSLSTLLTYVAIFQTPSTYGVNILQLIWYAKACSTYDQFLIRGSLLTNKLMSQGFLQTRLPAAFRKFHDCHYNVCQYSLPLGQMLSDVFHGAHGGCDRSAEDAYSFAAPDPTFAFVKGPCCPTLDFVIAF